MPKSLELKVPPPLVFLLCVGIMWLLTHILPSSALLERLSFMAWVLFAVGLALDLMALWLFVKVKTTVSPLSPKTSSSLVTTGIYRFSRNPMYVGLLMMLIATGFYLANFYTFLMCIVFVRYINAFQILPEERFLEEKFGIEFEQYKQSVRRWL